VSSPFWTWPILFLGIVQIGKYLCDFGNQYYNLGSFGKIAVLFAKTAILLQTVCPGQLLQTVCKSGKLLQIDWINANSVSGPVLADVFFVGNQHSSRLVGLRRPKSIIFWFGLDYSVAIKCFRLCCFCGLRRPWVFIFGRIRRNLKKKYRGFCADPYSRPTFATRFSQTPLSSTTFDIIW